jgi:hypothetical protein
LFGMTDERPIAVEQRSAAEHRLFSPSAARNRKPIRDVYLKHMPRSGAALEIASGTGEHAVWLAKSLPNVTFLPGDPDAASRASIAAWTAHERLENVRAPHAIDVQHVDWPQNLGVPVDALLCINMIHIAPFEAARGLFGGARHLLGTGGKMFLYGPFARDGAHTAPSNAAFDLDLKRRDRRWGVRDLDREVLPLAQAAGLALAAIKPMPANNLAVVFRRTAF